MQKLMHQWLTRLVLATAITAVAGPVLAQSGAEPKAPPAGYVAAPEPKPADTNAERAKSQPGNNAPMWRAARDSGGTPGISNLPGAEQGVLIQPMVQYPGVRLNNAGEFSLPPSRVEAMYAPEMFGESPNARVKVHAEAAK
jgi:formate dehydrogenase subunit gamma